MNNRLSDDPRNLGRECEAWDWVRPAGVTDEALRQSLVAGPPHAPRRRNSDRPAVRSLERFHRK